MRNPLARGRCASRSDRVGLEPTLLPDYPRKELKRQALRLAADSIIRHIASRVSLSPVWSPLSWLWGIASSSTLGLTNLSAVAASSAGAGEPRHREHDPNRNLQTDFRSHGRYVFQRENVPDTGRRRSGYPAMMAYAWSAGHAPGRASITASSPRPKAPNTPYSDRDRFRLTRHFAGRALSQAAEPRKVRPFHRGIL